jgi:predicted transcriptional regulator
MSKIVTLRLPESTYQRFSILAERENRSLSNFITTAALRYTESDQYVDDFEMKEIKANADLNRSLQRGVKDAKAGRGQFV